MEETQHRRVLIARELVTWGADIPALFARIAAALKMASLPGRQKLELEVLARRITASFKAIGEATDDDATDAANYAQLIERTDRLRELIATANEALVASIKQ
jgi:hypothetical protein